MAPKKNQQQKMSLGDFLGDQTLGSWADEMEDMPMPSESSRTGYGSRTTGTTGGWGGDRGDRAGFGDRGPSMYASREQLPMPTKPPFTAHLGNLSFDATEGDIQDFFAQCAVTNVRIVEDKIERKPKGFGYVEFGTLDGLKKALDLNNTQFQGRNIKISIAEPPKERAEAREFNDWTRKGPLPDLPNQRRTSENRSYGRFNDAESESGMGERGGSRRGGAPFEGDGRSRDFGNWERKGPLSPLPNQGPPREGGRGRGRGGELPVRERRNSPGWGEGRGEGQYEEAARAPRREFQEKPVVERQPTAADMDNQWRSKMRPDAPARSPSATPDASTPTSPSAAPAAPATRPRLNLQKRTVSEAQPEATSATSDAKASPFGAARPIDTSAREKEIEEKRQIAAKEKAEADAKAREEKKAKEAAAKAEKIKGAAAEGDEKTNGSASKNFEILQRANEEGEDQEDQDATTEDANGEIVEDKAVKPKEVTRDPPRKPSGGNSWRKPGAAATPEPTAEKLDADGWSTVTTNSRARGNKRGGNGGSRAIAS